MRIGNSGLLVRNTRRFKDLTSLNLERSLIISRVWSSLSHSSNASMTITVVGGWSDFSFMFVRGRKRSLLNCSSRDLDVIHGSVLMRLSIWGANCRCGMSSCLMILENKYLALPRSPSPCLKKYVAPSSPLSLNDRAIVRAMVDFPVPAIPFSQRMHLLSWDVAHSLTWASSSVLVCSRQKSSCSLVWLSYSASSIMGTCCWRRENDSREQEWTLN